MTDKLSEIQGLYTQVAQDALFCGIGIVKLTNTQDGLKFERVEPSDFLALADELKWTDSNTMKERGI